MHTTYLRVILLVLMTSSLMAGTSSGSTDPVEPVPKNERCPVCGMFVAKYKPWITQLHLSGGKVHMFDGVKDMMAYYFTPQQFGGKKDAGVTAVWVKDYYTMEWIDGTKALFVVGSDVTGPMGHELIPFTTQQAAESFLKDHKGREIIAFDKITPEQISELRGGHMMKKQKKMHKE